MPKNILTEVLKGVGDWRKGRVKEGYEAAEGLGKELGEKSKMVAEGRKALLPQTPAPGPKPPEPDSSDRINPKAQYGDRPGEKRIDVKEMTKPLGSFKKGGEVPKTGVYKMEKGEHVLTSPQKSNLKGVLDLAEGVLSHKDAEPEQPKKEIKELRIRRGASGGHIVTHVHTHFSHPDEEHVAPHTDALMDHIMEHYVDPDEDEEEAEEDNGMDGGKEAAEKALGYK